MKNENENFKKDQSFDRQKEIPLENIDRSGVKLNANPYNDVSERKSIKTIDLDSLKKYLVNVFWNFKKNKKFFNFGFMNYLKFSLFGIKGKESKNEEIMDYFSMKFYEKFDVLKYLKLSKKINFIRKIILNKNQLDLVKIINNKVYKFDSFKKKEKEEKNENEKIEEIAKKIIEENHNQQGEFDRKILEYLFE